MSFFANLKAAIDAGAKIIINDVEVVFSEAEKAVIAGLEDLGEGLVAAGPELLNDVLAEVEAVGPGVLAGTITIGQAVDAVFTALKDAAAPVASSLVAGAVGAALAANTPTAAATSQVAPPAAPSA